MKIRRTILVCMIGLFSWGLAGGVAAVLRTIGIYSGACEKLSGFPGVLQAAGFVPSGTCKFEPDNDQDKDKDKDKDRIRIGIGRIRTRTKRNTVRRASALWTEKKAHASKRGPAMTRSASADKKRSAETNKGRLLFVLF